MCLFALRAVKEKKFWSATPNTQAWEKCFVCLKTQEEEWRGTTQERRTHTEFLGQKGHSLRTRNMVFGLDRW